MKKISLMIAVLLIAGIMMTACTTGATPQIIEVPKIIEQPSPEESQSTLSVVSNASIKATPDVAFVYLGVITKNTDANTAQSENAQISAKFLEAIKPFGVTDKDIETSNINIHQDYQNEKEYVVENTYKVTINDLAQVGSVIDAATAAGVNSSYSLSFDVKNREELYIQALSQAMESAKVKAESMAQAGGYKLLRPLSISESGVATPYQMNTNEMSTAAADSSIPVSPGEIEISAGISATYIIK